VVLETDDRTEEDGEEADVLLSGLGNRLVKDLVLSVVECIYMSSRLMCWSVRSI
jgi:hypothetical protein